MSSARKTLSRGRSILKISLSAQCLNGYSIGKEGIAIKGIKRRIIDSIIFPPQAKPLTFKVGRENVVEIHEISAERLHFQVIHGDGKTYEFLGLPAGVTKFEEEIDGKTE